MKLELFICIGLALSVGCGSDPDDSGTNASQSGSSQTSSSGSSSGSDASSTSDSSTAQDSSGNEGEPPGGPCGSDGLVCLPGEACVRDLFDPLCMDYDPKTEECPEGTTPNSCGGPGGPCCCEPAPPPEHRCLAVPECGSIANCECALDPCPAEQECGAYADGMLECRQPLPA